ncbi:MAG: hypothetical protein AAGB35_02790 [Pseudomonadota bacterium]
MKSLIVTVLLALSIFSTVNACEDLRTTKEIVKYVCNYSLVSDTQCRIWTEDIRQMHYTNEIIVNSFLSWDESLKESATRLTAETN